MLRISQKIIINIKIEKYGREREVGFCMVEISLKLRERSYDKPCMRYLIINSRLRSINFV